MRKMSLAFIMAVTGSLLSVGAATAPAPEVQKPAPSPYRAAFIGGFWFGAPESIDQVNVDGVKLGLPISSGHGEVNGFEWALFCAATDSIYGFQWAVAGVSTTKNMNGFQMALVNSANNELNGMQMGIVNLGERKGFQLGIVNHADQADWQIGLVNFNKNGWMPFMVGFNRSK